MDKFVRKLVERLVDERRPLSRNRHFHTFDTPEGRTALRMARRLRALHRDITRCLQEGGAVEVRPHPTEGLRALELRISHRVGTHRAFLSRGELELLRGLPGLSETLGASGGVQRTG